MGPIATDGRGQISHITIVIYEHMQCGIVGIGLRTREAKGPVPPHL